VFSFSLFKQTIKSNSIMWGAMTLVMTILCIQFAAMEMTQPMLFTIFYGMMTTILPGIYVLVTANKLVSSQIDRGSMAYVLSTPTRRSTVVITQLIYLTGSLVVMFAIQTIAHLIVNNFNPISLSTLGYQNLNGDLTSAMILQVNLSALMVCVAMAGVCFLFSGIFSSSKYSIGFSGTFVGVTILANMLAMFGNLGVDGLENFKYLTICTFYDYESILHSVNDWITKMIFPAIIAVVTYMVGSTWFCKKDLPL
jgi:ABC-2 type transport system permease protein